MILYLKKGDDLYDNRGADVDASAMLRCQHGSSVAIPLALGSNVVGILHKERDSNDYNPRACRFYSRKAVQASS